MKRDDPENASPSLFQDLEKVTSTCDVCQREADAPHRFWVSMPGEDSVLNRTVCLALMRLEGKQVLYLVDKDKKFSVACFLYGKSTKNV